MNSDKFLDLVDLKEYGFLIDTTKSKEYSNADTFFLNKSAALALFKAREQLPKSYNFIIKDGFRTIDIQRKIVEITENELKKTNPDNWLKLLDTYTGGYEDLNESEISYMNHRSGNTVDLSITKDEKEIDMGDVVLNERDCLDYFENIFVNNKKDTKIRDNRRLLKKVMTSAGFKPYPLEWWHWGHSCGNNTF